MADLRGVSDSAPVRSPAATASAALTRDFQAIRPATVADENREKRCEPCAAAEKVETAPVADEFSVSERLLVAELVRRLVASTSAKRWRVASNAVVTPAARDELKKAGVELIRADAISTASEKSARPKFSAPNADENPVFLAIHLPTGERFPKFVEDYLTRNFAFDSIRLDCLKETTRQIAAKIEKNKATRTILTTRDAAIASIWANRLSGVRAVVAFSAEQAKRDLVAADANVLVLNPIDVAPYPFRQIVEFFLTR